MIGTLHNTKNGWIIKPKLNEDRVRIMQSYGDSIDEYPLHPDDVKKYCSGVVFFADDTEVEFKVVDVCVDSRAATFEEYEKNHISYARINDETFYLKSSKKNDERLVMSIQSLDNNKLGLYHEIEMEIINWSNDGTKTAGTLTRTIMDLINTKKESHSDQMIQIMNDDKEWDEIFHDYQMENYPPFGGPFTDAIPLEEWLKKYFYPPKRK